VRFTFVACGASSRCFFGAVQERSIPTKEEIIIDIELTTLQKKYYRAIYERNLGFLRKVRRMSEPVSPRLLQVLVMRA